MRALTGGPVHVALGEPDRLGLRAAAGNRHAQIAVGPDAHHVAARPPHPDEVDADLLRFFRFGLRLKWKTQLHGYFARYLFSQPNTDSCHSLLFSAFSTQWPSSSKTSASLGTPLRRSAVNNWRP